MGHVLLDFLARDDVLASWVKILASVVLLVVVLGGTTVLAKRGMAAPEQTRKLIHIGLGTYCLTFPWIFHQVWEVAATCGLALGVFVLARGVLRHRLGEGLHAVERRSYGEVLFAVSVAAMFWLQEGHVITVVEQGLPTIGGVGTGPILYVLPIAMLTWCDAASALVGSSYGRNTFAIERGKKSWEGVVVFVVVGWLVAMMCYLLFTDIDRRELIVLSFLVALFGALLEAASWRGWDNLFIPVGMYLLISHYNYYPLETLVYLSVAFVMALVAVMELTRREDTRRHVMISLAVVFFLMGLFSGPLSLITPALAALAYGASVTWLDTPDDPHDGLNMVIVIVLMAVVFFGFSHALGMDTIYAFNMAFAAFAAGVVARSGGNVAMVLGSVCVAVAALSVRLVWLAEPVAAPVAEQLVGPVLVDGMRGAGVLVKPTSLSGDPWSTYGLGCGVVLVTAGVAWGMRVVKLGRVWTSVGAVSTALAMGTLAVSF